MNAGVVRRGLLGKRAPGRMRRGGRINGGYTGNNFRDNCNRKSSLGDS